MADRFFPVNLQMFKEIFYPELEYLRKNRFMIMEKHTDILHALHENCLSHHQIDMICQMREADEKQALTQATASLTSSHRY